MNPFRRWMRVCLRFGGVRSCVSKQLLPSKICWTAALLWVVVGVPGLSQPVSSEASKPESAGFVRITLGNSAAELTGPWRFHTGDDLRWARPEFDDSSWETIDLTPPPGSDDPDLGTSGYVPGWTAQGHDGYAGYAWYRLRVDVQDGDRALALKMPDSVDDAYQVFVNGQSIGQFGHFSQHSVIAYPAIPRDYKLPADLRSGTLLIAIRMWMDSATPYNSPDAGGLHGPPVLGHAETIATQVLVNWDGTAHEVGIGFLEMLVLLLALTVSLTHYRMDPTDKAYLWLALVSCATLLGNFVLLSTSFTAWIPQTFALILLSVVIAPVRIGLWVLFWAYWFRVGPARWLKVAVGGLVLLLAAGTLPMQAPLYGPTVPLGASRWLVPLLLVAKLALAGLLVYVVYRGLRRRRSEGALALPAVLLAVAANYQHELHLIHVRTAFAVFGFTVSLGTASTMLSLLLVTLMLSRRFLHAERRRVRWGWEIEQARQVQQVMLPKEIPQVPGFRIEGDYRPAREVGGDFFQILPDEGDGSVLLVVGDVTGKGLCAGMMVAMIVGIVNAAARENPDPVRLLTRLNQHLCDHGHATATCLMLRIDRDGEAVLVNAGHLPPYRNGREVAMEGALPLGIVPGIDFPVTRFTLEDGDNLMLISDGVAEAQDAEGVLFGFERIGEVLRRPTTAAELAAAAQRFGQEDDILVLRVDRLPAEAREHDARRAAVLT